MGAATGASIGRQFNRHFGLGGGVFWGFFLGRYFWGFLKSIELPPSSGDSGTMSGNGATNTFGIPVAPPLPPSNGYSQNGGHPNPGFVPGVHEYDIPEGHADSAGKVGRVTINGITV